MNIPFKRYGELLGHYLKPQQSRVAGLAIALLGSIGLQILNPQLLGYFIDTTMAGGPPQALLTAALLFLGVALLSQILSIIATYFGETVAWTATNALRADLVSHCLQLDLTFHKAHTPGELLERIDGDVNVLARFFSQLVIQVIGNGLLLLGTLVVLFYENRLAGATLTGFALIALIVLLGLQPFAVAPWATYRQISAEFFGFLGEYLAGREDIRANGAVSYVMRQFHRLLQQWLPIYQKARFASTVLWATSVGLFTTGNAIALAVSAYLWQQQAITIGTAYVIFHYTNLLAQPIERIREELEELQQVEASLQRIQALLQVQARLPAGGDAVLPAGALAVTFEQVWFSYEESGFVRGTCSASDGELSRTGVESRESGVRSQASFVERAPRATVISAEPESGVNRAIQQSNDQKSWALQNLSFHLPAGQALGILGRTGSGKSTLARLLLRLYDPQIGTIRFGDVAIRQVPLKHLRQQVGFVTQDVQLFQASVRDNLTFFDPHIPDSAILEALGWLGLDEWLQSLPAGLDTLLGAENSGLSAGQAQLLAFARVFLKKPGLVILDEASSRLDPTTEQLIEHAVDQLLLKCTGIIIAHRLATVQRVDRILILENGQMVEYGDRLTLQQDPHSRFSQLLQAGSTSMLR
ncbi:ABC transporter ATP-binding protein [Leptolyngbya sp. NK1-12]|uniref:ABC transporter ATP-binding protein n=1 Tax=Leptolyngbya sp. NK1-12 TaxID=2547451 RepID=UPI00293100F4|nr:ABC transporter ATP-binding protein [Leptolyngbya sp. NK1-12]